MCVLRSRCVRWVELTSSRNSYRCSFLPFSTDEDHKREGMVLPGWNPEGDYGKQLLITTPYPQERYSKEEVEERVWK